MHSAGVPRIADRYIYLYIHRPLLYINTCITERERERAETRLRTSIIHGFIFSFPHLSPSLSLLSGVRSCASLAESKAPWCQPWKLRPFHFECEALNTTSHQLMKCFSNANLAARHTHHVSECFLFLNVNSSSSFAFLSSFFFFKPLVAASDHVPDQTPPSFSKLDSSSSSSFFSFSINYWKI